MFSNAPRSIWISVFASSLLSTTASAGVLHVNASSAAGGDGSSWALAFDTLDSALQVAGVDDEIWVARGLYLPTVEIVPGDSRSVSFVLPQGVELFGGFAGTETSLASRAGFFTETVLSGDVGVPGDSSDNARVVTQVEIPGAGSAGPVRLDGFLITAGNNDLGRGAGLKTFSTLVHVANCVFEDNTAEHGSAITAQTGQVRVKWCQFLGNTARTNGGAIWGQSTSYRIFNSIFKDNQAERGGAIYLHSILQPNHVVVANSVFTDNSADRGGAVHLGGNDFSAGHGIWQNCTFAYNSAVYSGGAIFTKSAASHPSIAIVRNSILWGNSAPLESQIFGRLILSYSIVQDQIGGAGNTNLDPLFVDVAARDLRLRPGSPAIDAADNASVANDFVDVDDDGILATEPTQLDVAAQPRFVDDPSTADSGLGSAPIADLGAYEFTP